MACLLLVGELAWFLVCTLLVTMTVASLISGGELAWFLVCTLLVIQTVSSLFQSVSWPHLQYVFYW